ncbi:MAG TPA: flagellar biosynthetic protein FliR [Clostridia bacterium]|nr:flagellar biosynthetic protein FliR [Clostridia bacterium]
MMLDIDKAIAGLVFVGVRVSGLLLFAPFLGSMTVPARVKASLAVAITALLWPAQMANVGSLTALDATKLIGSEFVIGLLMGLSVALIFDAVQLSGQVLGLQMGYSLVNIMDPQTQVDTPVLALFHQTIAMLIFLRLDVHHWMLRGVARSFGYMPAGNVMTNGAVADAALRAAGGIWLAGVQIAAPALAATMLADVALAFLGKASPQLPVLFIGLSVKNVLGLVMLISAISLWPGLMERYFSSAVETGERLLQLAH